MKYLIKPILRYTLSAIILLAVWKLVIVIFDTPPYVLPAPEKVINTLFDDFYFFVAALKYTLTNTLIGGILGVILGISTGIFLSYSRILRWMIEPYLMIFQSFPRESLFPLFLIWFGFGATPKILNSFLLSFFPVAVIVLNALINVDKSYITLTQSWYASRFQEYVYCRLPAAIPQIVSAIKIGMPLALIGAVLGEFMGGDQGLGYIIISSGSQFRVDRIFTSILVLALVGVSFLAVIQTIQRVYLQRFYH